MSSLVSLCVCVSLQRAVISCLASTHTALRSSLPSLALFSSPSNLNQVESTCWRVLYTTTLLRYTASQIYLRSLAVVALVKLFSSRASVNPGPTHIKKRCASLRDLRPEKSKLPYLDASRIVLSANLDLCPL